ncbi:Werner syndrome ATP-dependent helicase-like [Paramuricea clavata]|uniref:Werner syndrome ATP-dependent helicase-like n=1 Tax=Paramuricea clavata TaxID=317549 RepID=A0A7D9EYR2_PARCT|nr:Werner syndrome ATP-dependent helicase-like [Paramuricea clavata]
MSDNPTMSMINKMKVPELQAELTKRHLDTKGIKQVLVNRLLSSLEIVEPEAANDSNDDEQQNKAEGNMELAQDEEQDDYYKTEMSNDASGTGSLRDENKRLRCENTDLTERMNNLEFILADLNTKLKIAEDEKTSLLTAIRLIQSDGDVKLNNNNNIMTTKHLPQNTYKEVASRPKKVETADESEQEIISADEARPTSHGRKHDSKTQKSKKTTSDPLNKVDCNSSNVSTIHDLDSVTTLGDSMLKRLDVNRVRRSIDSNKRVIIRTFSGATIEDMKHYVEPALKRSPKAIIVHAGTNNIPRDRPEEIVSKLNDLGQHIEQNSQSCPILSTLNDP